MSLFSFFDKVLVYTALTKADYFKAVEAFESKGLKFKVKTRSNHSSTPGQHFNARDFETPAFYEFYVKNDDQHKAQQIISEFRKAR
ncbi:hypothetical protein ACFX4I_05235 [Peribacillus sp. YIM B13472]|uniref:hypothetical protein n=1 Tax=Peribacillus sp. YIM B13472 TaxID=3366297 RepID=UPI00366C0215